MSDRPLFPDRPISELQHTNQYVSLSKIIARYLEQHEERGRQSIAAAMLDQLGPTAVAEFLARMDANTDYQLTTREKEALNAGIQRVGAFAPSGMRELGFAANLVQNRRPDLKGEAPEEKLPRRALFKLGGSLALTGTGGGLLGAGANTLVNSRTTENPDARQWQQVKGGAATVAGAFVGAGGLLLGLLDGSDARDDHEHAMKTTLTDADANLREARVRERNHHDETQIAEGVFSLIDRFVVMPELVRRNQEQGPTH